MECISQDVPTNFSLTFLFSAQVLILTSGIEFFDKTLRKDIQDKMRAIYQTHNALCWAIASLKNNVTSCHYF